MARRTRSTAGLAGCLKRFFMSASITAIVLFLLRGALHFSGAAPDQPAEPAANGSPLPPSAPEAEIVATSAISVAPAAQFTPEASAEATRTEVATAAPVVQKKKGWELHQLPIIQGCEHCCSEDDHNAPCLDVELCAASGPEKGKYALALSHWGRPNEGMLGSIKSMRAAADLLGNTDIYMVMLETDAEQMTPKLHKIFAKWGVKLYPVKWDVPPDMKFYPKTDWCGHQDLIRLNVLGIEGYDAVAYFDGDCEFQGDITPMMRCAATGMFLSTSGGMGESLNVGFFAVRPDKRMVDAAVYFARENAFDRGTGWGGIGWAPTGGYYVGGECGQGFFYTLFHRRAENSRRALSSVGLWETWRSGQLDRCIWNYQTNSNCVQDLDCRHVRVHHKPTRERGSPSECDKIKFRRRREDLLRRQSEVRPPPSAEELRLAREGKRLKHLAGLCLRAAEEASDEQTTLLLLDCDFPPVEQNIRIVEDEADGGYVLLKQGGRCAHAEGDEDPEMVQYRLTNSKDNDNPHPMQKEAADQEEAAEEEAVSFLQGEQEISKVENNVLAQARATSPQTSEQTLQHLSIAAALLLSRSTARIASLAGQSPDLFGEIVLTTIALVVWIFLMMFCSWLGFGGTNRLEEQKEMERQEKHLPPEKHDPIDAAAAQMKEAQERQAKGRKEKSACC